MIRSDLEYRLAFGISPWAVRIRRVLLPAQSPDAFRRVLSYIPPLGAPGENEGQYGFDVVGERATTARGLASDSHNVGAVEFG